jgi:tetratricopeptide (TPR) repeat protein
MDLIQPLARLEAIELIRRLNDSLSDAGDLAYLFKHALVQDTAYASLLKNERKRLHRLIAETLERVYPDAVTENAALLTKHFAEAGDDAKILEYGFCAGDAAARVYANAEAIAHYRVALDAARRLAADRATIIALVTKLGRVYELQSEYQHALETYASLIELAQTRGEPAYELAGLMLQATLRATPTSVFEPRIGQVICDRALQLARDLNDGAAQAKILWNLLLLNGFTGQHDKAVMYGEQSLALARQLNLKTQIAYTLNDIGNYGYFANGQPEKSRAALQEARGMWRELDILPMLSDNLNNSGILEYIWGDYAQAQLFSDEALELSERIGSLWGQGLARSFRGLRKAEAGDYGAALTELQTAYELASRTGSGIMIIAATNLALAYSAVGEIERGFAVIQIADHEIEIPLYRAPAKAALAYLTFLRGEVERAEMILQDAHPRSQGDLEFSYLPTIIAEGEIGLARGRAEHVAEYTETLAAGLLKFGIKSFVADADLYRGCALMQLGRFDDARGAFERGYVLAQELGSRRVLWQIYAHWAVLERAASRHERAAELETQARALIQAIGATLSNEYRAAFLQNALAILH